jgi:hypothetical protein
VSVEVSLFRRHNRVAVPTDGDRPQDDAGARGGGQLARAQEALTRHTEIDASDVCVENCEVTLTGVVEDRRAKRLAEEIAESVLAWPTCTIR